MDKYYIFFLITAAFNGVFCAANNHVADSVFFVTQIEIALAFTFGQLNKQ